MQKTLGGDRLGSGNKMKVDLHNFERSTHDLSYVWRSTMAPGTLVPFIKTVALPGDTFNINLELDCKTKPTVGPLFGSYKAQLDVFVAPIRLYNALLHNNALGIGLNMSQVKLPVIEMTALPITDYTKIDTAQIEPSTLLSYLGIKGIGNIATTATSALRTFNAVPILAYWEIYKNYYANKQEEIGSVLHTPSVAIVNTVTSVKLVKSGTEYDIPQAPGLTSLGAQLGDTFRIYYTGTQPIPSQILIQTQQVGLKSLADLGTSAAWTVGTGYIWAPFRQTYWGDLTLRSWAYKTANDINTGAPAVATFPLSNIDDMRNAILSYQSKTTPFKINTPGLTPYSWLPEQPNGIPNVLSNQEGLGLKTYQSDMFNNWLKTEYIDGTNGIAQITAISTASGSFTIDTLNLSKKVYDMLNRIAVSGGSYDDWLDAVYAHDRYQRAESPMYMGGMIREVVFQEILSTTTTQDQPLGTLAGRGTLSKHQKGGHVVCKIDEPSYIIGIVSLTPRVDYSQGNAWDTSLETLDDLHKPNLDEIGFQELITEPMAYWDTTWDGTKWVKKSAGKQPAWLNYMTDVNKSFGNFAKSTSEMFMTLNRRYSYDSANKKIKDLTTYIDPSKFNFIFAETSLDAQNFWVQIGVNMIARRKMSAKLMPNL